MECGDDEAHACHHAPGMLPRTAGHRRCRLAPPRSPRPSVHENMRNHTREVGTYIAIKLDGLVLVSVRYHAYVHRKLRYPTDM